MSKINTTPVGLQDFLGSKNFGRNPSELGQVVSPSLDLKPFLGVYEQRLARATDLRTGVGVCCSLTVPEGEAWYLIAVSARIDGAVAAANYRLAITLESPIGGIPTGIGMPLAEAGTGVNLVAGDLFGVVYRPSEPQILNSGTILNLHYYKNVGVNQSGSLFAWYYALTI